MRLPWISREMHDAVCSEKDRHIVTLRAQIAGLEKRLAEPIAITVKLPDDFAVAMPMVVRDKRLRKPQNPENPEAPQEVVDWANVDENDPAQLAKIATLELGGPTNAYVLAKTIARIKHHIVTAKTQKLIRALEKGSVGTIISPDTKVVADEVDIPESIRQRIADAERV